MAEVLSQQAWDEGVLKECFESTRSYLQLVATVSEAGSSWSHNWGALLAQTPYGGVARHFQAACQDIHKAVSRDTDAVLQDLSHAHDHLTQNGRQAAATETPVENSDTTESKSEKQPEDYKIIAKSFLSLVALHCQIFVKASESFAQFSKLFYNEDSTGLPVCPESSVNDKVPEGSSSKSDATGGSSTKSDGVSYKQVVGSPSGLRKLSSFLSKLGRSGSSPSPTDLSQSLFYVEMPENPVSGGNTGAIPDQPTKATKTAEQAASGEHSHQVATTGANAATRDSITQEELDSVIDFLSGFKVPMQTIHEHGPVPLHTNSRVVGSQLHHKEALEYYTEAAAKPYTQKTNTWPYRPSTKTGEISSYSAFGLGESATADPEYWRYLNAVRSMKHSTTNTDMSHRPAWSSGDAALNRSWPHHTVPHEGYEAGNRGWSCVTGDSSSCSDDSSNGEATWLMGLDLMNSVNSKRRHSSGEDGLMPANHVAVGGVRPNPGDSRPRSVEDLLESKSNKTWPPKQPWLKEIPAEGTKTDDKTAEGSSVQAPVQPYHPPLTMQWSDPLTSRPLSTWGTGLNPSLSNQTMTNFGSGVL